MKEEVLRIENVTRKVDGILILDNVNFHIFKGEIMGLIFLTAHGKNELIELLCRNIPIDYGRIYYKNELVNYYEYSSMTRNPIYVISQNNRLINNLTVADNIFVMRRGLKKHIINRTQLRNQFYHFFMDENHIIDPDKLILELSLLDRCLVELFRAVVADCRLIIIQDIASFLSAVDLVKFYEYIRYYSNQGVAFIYIGNHHEELFQISNRVALMRNARVLKVLDHDELTDQNIKPYSISFNVSESVQKEMNQQGILTFRHVTTQTLKEVSFSVQKGECVVMLDKSNDIYMEFLELINGEKEPISGQIYYQGENYSKKKGTHAVDNGILAINKNPTKTMLFWDMSYIDNLIFLIDRKLRCTKIKRSVKKSVIEEYKKYVGEEIYSENLSELELNSLYNLVYYRVHLYNPNILICIHPFTGMDMYLRRHIVDLLYKLKLEGITIIIFTLNIADSLAIADRMVVLEDGRIAKVYDKKEFSHSLQKE